MPGGHRDVGDSPLNASPLPLVRLKTRSQFLKIAAKGRKIVRPTLVLQAMSLTQSDQNKAKQLARKTHLAEAAYVGFTASKKVGNAVARNRAKRRLTAAVRDILPTTAQAGWGYVIIARGAALEASFPSIEHDLAQASTKIGASDYRPKRRAA